MFTPAAEPRVALAHHWLMSMRGGEKTLAALAGRFPQAPIFTLVARPDRLDPDLRRRRIITSWLQRFAWLGQPQRKALPVLFAAARSLDATAYDVVICSDAAGIKAIRTRPDGLKICYCHSPMRYVWDLQGDYIRGSGRLTGMALRMLAPRVRRADRAAAETVDAFVANSTDVAERIRRCYDRPCVVIHPPVEVPDRLVPPTPEDFYLVLGEHVPYKRHDLAIAACNALNRPLVVIGGGPLLDAARKQAGPTVRVLGWQPDDVVRDHLRRCRAVLFCGREDFGLVPVEALAAGRPVIVFGQGGALETIQDGTTGVFFQEPSVPAVVAAIQRFENELSTGFDPATLCTAARRFSSARFNERFMRFFHWCLHHHQQGGPAAVRAAMQTADRAMFLAG